MRTPVATALVYGDDISTSNIVLRGDSTVTFANSLPTAGNGGYPDGAGGDSPAAIDLFA